MRTQAQYNIMHDSDTAYSEHDNKFMTALKRQLRAVLDGGPASERNVNDILFGQMSLLRSRSFWDGKRASRRFFNGLTLRA